MKISRFSEPQIMGILKQADSVVPVAELCREHGMSSASFYKWRSKYSGMDASMLSQMKAIEDDNARLKKMFAELSMENERLKAYTSLFPEQVEIRDACSVLGGKTG